MCIAYCAGNVEGTYIHVCVCSDEYRSQTVSPTEQKSTVLPFITALNADTNCQSCFDSFGMNMKSQVEILQKQLVVSMCIYW